MTFTIDEIKTKSKKVFEKNDFVEKAYIFGSYANETANDDSDIDFVIEYNNNVGIKFYGLYPDLQDTFNKNVDILTVNEFNDLKPFSMKRERILIYER